MLANKDIQIIVMTNRAKRFREGYQLISKRTYKNKNHFPIYLNCFGFSTSLKCKSLSQIPKEIFH